MRGITRYAYGGLVFKIFGAYPATVGIKDYEKMLMHHINILCRGHSVCIFPEGGLSKNGELGQGSLVLRIFCGEPGDQLSQSLFMDITKCNRIFRV